MEQLTVFIRVVAVLLSFARVRLLIEGHSYSRAALIIFDKRVRANVIIVAL